MEIAKNIKITLSIIYLIIIFIFLWLLFKNFTMDDFTSYELIKSNRDTLNTIKDKNIILTSIVFFLITIFWVLLLGFGSPIFLVGGFIFGKWLGTLVVLFGLTTGATILYILANYLLKDLIFEKFSNRFNYLIEKFNKQEFLYFTIYRAIGGLPFFIQNLLPALFNIKIRTYFFGSLLGLAPQLFVGVSLGAGIDKLIDSNSDMPSIVDMFTMPDIYIPILALVSLMILAFFLRKIFFKK